MARRRKLSILGNKLLQFRLRILRGWVVRTPGECNRFVCLLVAGEEFKMGLGEGGGKLKTELGVKMSQWRVGPGLASMSLEMSSNHGSSTETMPALP